MHRLARTLTIGRLAGLITIAAFVALRFWDPAPLEILRGKIFDLYQIAHPRVAEDYPVTIVDIDDRSLKALGQWPWSRAVVARLVDRLADGGAAAIGFDTIFAEPDRLSPHRIADTLKIEDASTRAVLDALPDSDGVLVQSIDRARVVLGQAGERGIADAAAEPKGVAGNVDRDHRW